MSNTSLSLSLYIYIYIYILAWPASQAQRQARRGLAPAMPPAIANNS